MCRSVCSRRARLVAACRLLLAFGVSLILVSLRSLQATATEFYLRIEIVASYRKQRSHAPNTYHVYVSIVECNTLCVLKTTTTTITKVQGPTGRFVVCVCCCWWQQCFSWMNVINNYFWFARDRHNDRKWYTTYTAHSRQHHIYKFYNTHRQSTGVTREYWRPTPLGVVSTPESQQFYSTSKHTPDASTHTLTHTQDETLCQLRVALRAHYFCVMWDLFVPRSDF